MIKLFSDDKYNVAAQALLNLSGATTWSDDEANELIYRYLAEVPKTSLVVELVNEIERVKTYYKIKTYENNPRTTL